MNEIPLIFPFGGINEAFAKAAQPNITTPDAVNVQVTDKIGDRARGGTRDPLTRQAGPVNSTNAVRQIFPCQFDNPGVAFTELTQGNHVEDWKKATPLIQSSSANHIDLDGNRYAVDGRAGIVKFNRAGERVWKFVLPVESQEHVVRALWVSDDGTIYVGVSAGYPQSTSKLMKYRPASDGESPPSLEWTIGGSDPEPGLELGGYVEQIRLRDGVLFAACNFPDTGKSEIRMYRLIDTAVPEIGWKREQVPHPINDMDIRDSDGAIITAHEANATRAYYPGSPDTTKIARDWWFDKLDRWDARKWCELDASDLDGDGTLNEDWDNGESLLSSPWFDKTGNSRNAYSYEFLGLTAPTNCTPPVLNKSKRFAGQDTVVFTNPTAGIANAYTALVSNTNSTTTAGTSGLQRTLIPCYDDAWWTVFMVVRTSDFTNMRAILSQVYTTATTYRAFVLNANSTGASGLTSSSGVAVMHQSNPGPVAAEAGPYAAYDSTTGFAVIAVTCKSDGIGALTADLCAINGTDCTQETYTGRDLAATDRTQLGRWATSSTSATAVLSVAPFDGELAYFLAIRDYLDSSGTKTIISNTEFEKGIGALHWRFGIAHKLPVGHPYEFGPPTDDPLPGGSDSAYRSLTDPKQMLVKWDPNKARARWVLKDSSTVGIGGIGYACAWPKNGSVKFAYSVGPKGTAVGGTDTLRRTERSVVRKVLDLGDSVAHTGQTTEGSVTINTWESLWGTFTSGTPGDALEPTYHYPRICVSGKTANDPDNASAVSYLYVPVHGTGAVATHAFYRYNTTGSNNAGTGTDSAPSITVTLASQSRGYAVSVDKFMPEYVAGANSSIADEYVFVSTELQGSSTDVLSNVLMVSRSRSNANPRATYVAAVAGNSLRRITGSVLTPVSAPTLAGGNYCAIESARDRLWIADGTGYYVLDPRLSDGVSKVWKSKTAGSLPKGGRLLCYWNGRMLISRAESPDEVFGTAIDDPYDCDVSPVNPSGAEAFVFSAGESVNALIPLSKDIFMVGTQTKLLAIVGDPAQGGIQERVGDVQGVAFGEAWCKDPEGLVYVFGSRGGVNVVSTRGSQSISEQIRNRLQSIDMSLFFIRLVWDWRRGGLHVFAIPQGTGSGTPYSYFWHKATASWWKYEYPWWPTSARLVDGDGINNRAVWVGFEDGYIRRFDPAGTDDDGTAIAWSVYGGPIRDQSGRSQVNVHRPKFVFGTSSVGVTVGLYASGDSERPTTPGTSYALTGTLTNTAPIHLRGANVWWRLNGSGLFAYEDGTAVVEPFGLRRTLP